MHLHRMASSLLPEGTEGTKRAPDHIKSLRKSRVSLTGITDLKAGVGVTTLPSGSRTCPCVKMMSPYPIRVTTLHSALPQKLALTKSLWKSRVSLTMKMRSKRERMVVCRSMFSCAV